MRELARFISENREKPVLLVLHSQADADTVASAIALSEYFTNAKICTPDEIDSEGKRIRNYFKSEIQKFESLSFSPEALIILDTNSEAFLTRMLDYVRNFKGPVVVLDHHSIHPDAIKATHSLIENSASSTCELVYEIFRELNFAISRRTAEALLTGIVFDSAEFRAATTRTIEITAYLLKRTKMTLAQFFALAEPRPKADQRIALLKAFARATSIRAGDFVIATSEASTYEAAIAEELVLLGADFAFVAQETRNELRISARCLPSHVSDYGIDLAAIMDEVGKAIGGTGGGHPAAAGVDSSRAGRTKEALSLCVELVKRQLKAASMKRIAENISRA